MEELADISLIKELPELTDLIVDEYEDEILSQPQASSLHGFEYVSAIYTLWIQKLDGARKMISLCHCSCLL